MGSGVINGALPLRTITESPGEGGRLDQGDGTGGNPSVYLGGIPGKRKTRLLGAGFGGLGQQKVEPNMGFTEKNLHFKAHYWTKLKCTAKPQKKD